MRLLRWTSKSTRTIADELARRWPPHRSGDGGALSDRSGLLAAGQRQGARTGLRVKAVLDSGTYPTGLKVEDEVLRDVGLRRHKIHPDWNYTVESRSP